MSLRGEAGWQATYQKAFGKERWPGLCKALKGTVKHVALVNPFLPAEAQARICEERKLRPHGIIPRVCEVVGEEGAEDHDGEGLLAPRELSAEEEAGPPATVTDAALLNPARLMPCYFLDGASAVAALALGVEPGQKVLDLCAAPGGKSLLLASALFAPQLQAAAASEEAPRQPTEKSILVCNEPSRPRAQRLQKVLSSFLPGEFLAPGGGVHITMEEATASKAGPPVSIRRLAPFDRILVDAPCTSDRHLARQGKSALSHWAAGAVKSNAERQLEILQCAAPMVKQGGRLLYCTCALAELENDGVVAKFLKKALDFEVELPRRMEDGEGVKVADLLIAEGTASGALFLPDQSSHGPMYIASLIKVS